MQWSDGKVSLHREWSRAMEGRYYMRSDKRKWFQLEQYFLDAEQFGKPSADYYLDCARRFADEAANGYADWLEGKPWFLCD